jgi:hypothetical protein
MLPRLASTLGVSIEALVEAIVETPRHQEQAIGVIREECQV